MKPILKKDLKRCPFCGGRVGEAEGIGGLLFFACLNYKECGAIVSFDQETANNDPEKAREMFNTRKYPRSKWNVYEVANTDEEDPIAWRCENCGEVVSTKYHYCPECGYIMTNALEDNR